MPRVSDVKIQIQNLSLSFKNAEKITNAIDDLSFSIEPGKTFALLGESGCGKSLTASGILQLIPNNAFYHANSKIFFDEQDLLELSEHQMQAYRGVKVAMIFQEPMTSLNPVLTIGQQLIETLKRNGKYSRGALKAKAIDLLEKVEIPEPSRRINDYPHQLSGGQIQRVMISMAIACQPDLLIADEPTTALDVTIQAQILELLSSLCQELNMAMLLITHDLSIVKQVADHVGIMYAGQLVECCEVNSFFNQPRHPYSQRLLQCLPSIDKRNQKLQAITGIVPSLDQMPTSCRFKPRCFKAQEKCEVMPELDDRASHQVRCHFQNITTDHNNKIAYRPNKDSLVSDQEILLKVTDVKVHYPIYKGLLRRTVNVVKAVDGVSFDVTKGETLALVGESGCGKTTLSRAICQLLPITNGKILFDNKYLSKNSREVASALQIVFQDPFSSMNPRMLVNDILLEGIRAQKQIRSSRQLAIKAKNLLEMVGLSSNSGERYPHEFSGGQRQRISIARALAVEPKLLICDEPTSALDVSVQAQILNLLLELQNELDLSYLFISHDLAVVSYMADRIMVMKEGKIIEQGIAEQLLNCPNEGYTKKLLYFA